MSVDVVGLRALAEKARKALALYQGAEFPDPGYAYLAKALGDVLSVLEPAVDEITTLRAENERLKGEGSCWDEAPQIIVPAGECSPMPARCELRSGHGGAHKSGRTEWMHRSPYNEALARAQAAEAALADRDARIEAALAHCESRIAEDDFSEYRDHGARYTAEAVKKALSVPAVPVPQDNPEATRSTSGGRI